MQYENDENRLMDAALGNTSEKLPAHEYRIGQAFPGPRILLENDEPASVIFQHGGVESLRLDAHGMHYQGQKIDDAGQAYELMRAWLDGLRKIQVTLAPASCQPPAA